MLEEAALLPVAALSAAAVGVATVKGVVAGKVAGWAAVGWALVVAMAVVIASLAMLHVQLRLGQPKIVLPSHAKCPETLLPEGLCLAPHTEVTLCHPSHTHQNLGAYLHLGRGLIIPIILLVTGERITIFRRRGGVMTST